MNTAANTIQPNEIPVTDPTVALAIQLQTARAFKCAGFQPVSDRLDSARAIVEDTVRSVIYGPALRESFSDLIPRPMGHAMTDDLIPIDEVLGTYSPDEQKVTVYSKSIALYAAHPLRSEPRQLETIVRLHEYAHAVVHLGITAAEELQLHEFPETETDWQAIREGRDCFFKTLNQRAHEFLAQAITWSCLGHPSLVKEQDDLRRIFLDLARRQPPVYDIPEDLLPRLGNPNWGGILATLRDRKFCDLDPTANVATAVESTIRAWSGNSS